MSILDGGAKGSTGKKLSDRGRLIPDDFGKNSRARMAPLETLLCQSQEAHFVR